MHSRIIHPYWMLAQIDASKVILNSQYQAVIWGYNICLTLGKAALTQIYAKMIKKNTTFAPPSPLEESHNRSVSMAKPVNYNIVNT